MFGDNMNSLKGWRYKKFCTTYFLVILQKQEMKQVMFEKQNDSKKDEERKLEGVIELF